MDTKTIVDMLKSAIDAAIEFENSPTRYTKTRNGWAAYRGNPNGYMRRITRYYFSEQGAREAVIDRDSSDVKTTFVD
jgi:hypothetical protein